MPPDGQPAPPETSTKPPAEVNARPARAEDPARGSYAPWSPPKQAATFTLKRLLPGGGVEDCTFWTPQLPAVMHRHPLTLPDGSGKGLGQDLPGIAARVLLETWGSGSYRASFHTAGGRLAGSPVKFELLDPAFPSMPAAARAGVEPAADEEEEAEDALDDDEDEAALDPEPASDLEDALRRATMRIATLEEKLRREKSNPFRGARAQAVRPLGAPAPVAREREPRRMGPPSVPSAMSGTDAMQWFFFWQEKAEGDAERRVLRIEEEQRARRIEDEERHRRNLEEMDRRHLRSLELERAYGERNNKQSSATRDLARRLDELETEPEPEKGTDTADVAKAIVSEALPGLLAFAKDYLDGRKGGAS